MNLRDLPWNSVDFFLYRVASEEQYIMKSSGMLCFYAYIMVFLYCSWPMTLWYLPLPRPNGMTRASTPWRWKTPLVWKHRPSTSTSLVSWQIFSFFLWTSLGVLFFLAHNRNTTRPTVLTQSTHKGNTHAHNTPAESYRRWLTYLSIYPIQFIGINTFFSLPFFLIMLSIFQYGHIPIWPYWKMDNIIFHEILLF